MYYFLEYWKKTSICKFCINLRIFLNFIMLIKIFIELIEGFNKYQKNIPCYSKNLDSIIKFWIKKNEKNEKDIKFGFPF